MVAALLLTLVAFQFGRQESTTSETPSPRVTETTAEPKPPLESEQEAIEREETLLEPGEETILEPAHAQAVEPGPATPVRLSEPGLEDIIGQTVPAVVSIASDKGTGSGFFVQPDLIVTNSSRRREPKACSGETEKR